MATLRLHVKPRSSRSAILECREGVWEVALHAPPEEGRANQELVRLVAKALGVSASSVELAAGGKSRTKTLAVEGVDQAEAERLLAAKAER